MLAENVNDLKSHGLIDENIVVDNYADIDFEVCLSETHGITDQEFLDSSEDFTTVLRRKRKKTKSQKQTMCL